jgi:ornithine decarboxylase
MLFTPVYGLRERAAAPPAAQPHMDYWLTDGVYGSFNCILYDDQKPQPIVVPDAGSPGLVWGPRAPLRASRSQLPGGSEGGGGASRRQSRCQLSEGGAPGAGEEKFSSTLWGPTCDSMDYVYKDIQLPRLAIGDWLLFPRCGAYTVAGACDFNGIAMTQPRKFFVFSDSAVDADADGDALAALEESEEEEEEALPEEEEEEEEVRGAAEGGC